MRQAFALSTRVTPGRAVPRAEPSFSPLDHTPVLYCRWTVERRRLARGVDDAISGEVTAPFDVIFGDGTRRSIDLDAVVLNLAPEAEQSWTANEDGLPPGVRARAHAAFPDRTEGALYHLTQVTLPPDARVWLSVTGGALSDRAPDLVRRGALVAAALRAAPALALLATGVAAL